jgi:hypothetical protein
MHYTTHLPQMALAARTGVPSVARPDSNKELTILATILCVSAKDYYI